MKQIVVAAVISFILAATRTSADPALGDQQRIDTSRTVVGEFAAKLEGELKNALQSGGPKAAISVCSSIAPAIAFEASQKTGWDVGRTSLKLRNPNNGPDAWEEKVLREFETQRAAGKPVETMEVAAWVERDGKSEFRYMKAIGVQQTCLACHGRDIVPDVKKALAELYPDDKAIGYALGDIRGAFRIMQPSNN
jgi:hypothetical protein